MTGQQKDAVAIPQQTASINQTASSIPQNTASTQVKKSKSKEKKPLALGSRVYSISIKCYIEQLPYGLDETYRRIRAFDKKRMFVMAILHCRDIVTDGIWACPLEKAHLHIIARCTTRKQREYVNKILDELGVYFRPGIDDDLWKNRGVETAGDFNNLAVYLTHETKEAVLEGKELYDVTEIVSNLTLEEIEQIREGYNRLVDGKKRVTTSELEALDKEAEEMGYEMKNFESWYGSQPFIVRSNAKMRTIRESYERGVSRRLQESSQICRMCVFIHGKPNTGKTYAAEQALAGKRQLHIGGGGTGKLDELRCDHEAIIVDDDVLPNLLNMSDNKICRAYKRNRNNPPWAGKYLVVTSNLRFDAWVEKCGIKVTDYYGQTTAHYKALLSRFCIGRILESTAGFNQLYIQSMSTRGSAEVQEERANMMRDFLQKYNDVIKTYDPKAVNVDTSNIVSDLSQFGSIT